MAKIHPVVFPGKGTATILNVKVSSFNMDDTTATFYYELYAEEEEISKISLPTTNQGRRVIKNYQTVTTVSKKLVSEGNLTMNENEFSLWGADNNYCIQWAATKLGLVLDEYANDWLRQ